MRIDKLKTLAMTSLLSVFLFSATPKRYSYDNGYQTLIQEMQNNISGLRHQVTNQETELRIFEEKINNQEIIIDSLRDQLTNATQANKELLKVNQADIEGKIGPLDNNLKGLVSDTRQIKTHANDLTVALNDTKQRLNELEKMIQAQNQHMASLENALKSMMTVLQAGDSSATAKTYKIQPGDTLEKIAQRNATTIKAIKELNGFTNDKIVVGQTIKLP
jgi:LysM repeat protein